MVIRSLIAMGLIMCALLLQAWPLLLGCSMLQEPRELPPECSDRALMDLEANYSADVLDACQGKTFDTCQERSAIEQRYRRLREEWAACPQHRQ